MDCVKKKYDPNRRPKSMSGLRVRSAFSYKNQSLLLFSHSLFNRYNLSPSPTMSPFPNRLVICFPHLLRAARRPTFSCSPGKVVTIYDTMSFSCLLFSTVCLSPRGRHKPPAMSPALEEFRFKLFFFLPLPVPPLLFLHHFEMCILISHQ